MPGSPRCSCGRSTSSWMASPALRVQATAAPARSTAGAAPDMRSAFGPRAVAVARLGQRHAEARGQRPAGRAALHEPHLRPQRHVAPVGDRRRRSGIVERGHARPPTPRRPRRCPPATRPGGAPARPDACASRRSGSSAPSPMTSHARLQHDGAARAVAASSVSSGRVWARHAARRTAARDASERARRGLHGPGTIMDRWLLQPDASTPPVPAATPTPARRFRLVVTLLTLVTLPRRHRHARCSSTTTCATA